MQPKFTLNRRGVLFGLTPILFSLFFLLTGKINAQQYVNGNLSTGATSISGVAAPAGTTWSECQNPTGNTNIANTNAGYGAQIVNNYSVADDFVVPTGGPSWNLTKITVYAYSTGYTGSTSPFNDLRIRIHNSSPLAGPTTIVFGDLTTNRLSSSSNSSMYRIFNTVVAPATAPGTTRIIWKLEANVSVTLAPGTYWLEYSTGTALTSNFTPPSTPVGVRTVAGYNALQNAAGVWGALVDDGQGPSAPQSVPVDFPFIIDYTTGPCSGTPNPGNTLPATSNVCAGTNFTLTLQNLTPGSGVTYQWQSAPAAAGPWANISGATSSSYTAAMAATTYYRCNVTCSGNTGTSTAAVVNLNAPSACYCVPPTTNCSLDDEILNVTLGTLNNSSSGCSGAGYSNYTALTAPTVYSGANNPIRVTVGPGGSENAGVWIDYNKNGQFEVSEFTYLGAISGGTLSANIAIPTTATSGTTRMRVRVKFSTPVLTGADACAAYTYGETEDYTVDIQPCVPVTITTQPASASITCGNNTSFTVATAGSLPVYSWEYRPNSSSAWFTVTNGGVYSGASTTTLTLTGISAAYSGYQYRAVVVGACSATDVSQVATLTVNPLVPVVTPSSATICNGAVQQLTLTNTLSNTVILTEGFNTVLPSGWAQQNNSTPLGTTNWFQGNSTVFASYSGAADGYIAANWQNTTTSGSGTIDNWLFTPVLNVKNGDVITFYSRIPTDVPEYPDRLQVRISSNGSSTNVADFSNLLLTINPSLVTGVYPKVWTQFTATVSGLSAPTTGRVAFRYWVTDGGGGSNSNYIGIDDFVYTSAGSAAQGVWDGPTGTIFTNAGGTTAYVPGTPLTTVYVKPTATSNYTVNFTTLTPCTSSTTTVPVTVSNPATALTVTPATRAVCLGGSTTFTASVATGNPLAYQWQVSTDGGLTYNNISGATSATLTVSGVTATMSGNRYRFVVTSAPCAAVTSTSIGTLTVNPLPVVSVTASRLSIYPGVTSIITASSNPAASSYSWTYNGSPLPRTVDKDTVNIDELGTYTVTATSAAGCVSSAPATITIGAEAADKLWIYPNPNQGAFQVRLYYVGTPSEKRVINIYNSAGQLVVSKEFDMTNLTSPYLRMDFDLGPDSKGTYVVKAIDKYTGRIVSGLAVIQ
ncbi:MAG TPA: choice-of-anchor J domain-containing protein [Chitinophagaceae bacterium]|mgnify:CR=1 FL=1|nr:choice-of-anchor J domain-containing protein [Chitinophagaceae bacterium]